MEAEQRLAIGERIRELRGPRTQQPIADHVGVTLRAYQAWEAGGGIAWSHLEKLADYFNVSTNYLLYGQDAPPARADRNQLDRIEKRLDEIHGLLTGDEEIIAAISSLPDRLEEAIGSPPNQEADRSSSGKAARQRKNA